MAKKMAREAAFFVCALACGAEKWYDNYLRNVREVILYEIRYRRIRAGFIRISASVMKAADA